MYRSAVGDARSDPVVAPPEFFRLAGDPLRWRLLTELARSDRQVQELTGLLDRPQNLVSYRLGKGSGSTSREGGGATAVLVYR